MFSGAVASSIASMVSPIASVASSIARHRKKLTLLAGLAENLLANGLQWLAGSGKSDKYLARHQQET